MSSLNKVSLSTILLSYFPLVIMFLSVFNEINFNYLNIEYFSFNFVHILVFFWTLKNPNHLGYVAIFIAGIINDVVVGIPIGISSLCYLLICTVTAYIRNITLSPNVINDWFSFLFTILLINSIQVIILNLLFVMEVDYMRYLINTGFTFILYPFFFFMFNYINKKIIIRIND
tara:strand:- start:1705 stop:2223 length:519 start_codon:yes stop_codon:yes gene_type:complete